MSKIFISITTFNPDLDLFKKNLNAVLSNEMAHKLIIYNNSKNRDDIIKICADKNIEYVLYNDNYGVAKPLKDGIDYALNNGFDYVLTLDQDSVLCSGYIKKLYSVISGDDNIAMVGGTPSSNIDENSNDFKYTFVNGVITSGTIASVKIIAEIGNYIPELFIDWVDVEMCYRIREAGYKIAQCDVQFLHTFGDPIMHKLFFKSIIVANYSPMRNYFVSRNIYYCYYRYPNFRKEVNKNKKGLLVRFIITAIYEKNKLEKLKMFIKGKKDAKNFYKMVSLKYY